jgi:small basic protein
MWFVLAVLAASYLVTVPLALLAAVLPIAAPSPPPNIISMGIVEKLVVGSVIAPLVETAIFQAVPIAFLRTNTGLRYPSIIFISALLFAASHFYSWAYVAFAFCVGIVLAHAYAVRRRPDGRPFVLVAVAHGIHNAVASFIY